MNPDQSFSNAEVKRFNELYEQANELTKGLIILDGKSQKNPGFFGKRRLRKAIKLYESAIEINPGSWQSMFFAGKAFQSLGEMEEALTWFLRAHDFVPTQTSVAKEVGNMAGRLGKHDIAIRAMESAAKENPNDSGLHTNLGLSCLMTGKAAEACSAFELTVKLEPTNKINQQLLALAREVQSGKRPAPKTEREISAAIDR